MLVVSYAANKFVSLYFKQVFRACISLKLVTIFFLFGLLYNAAITIILITKHEAKKESEYQYQSMFAVEIYFIEL